MDNTNLPPDLQKLIGQVLGMDMAAADTLLRDINPKALDAAADIMDLAEKQYGGREEIIAASKAIIAAVPTGKSMGFVLAALATAIAASLLAMPTGSLKMAERLVQTFDGMMRLLMCEMIDTAEKDGRPLFNGKSEPHPTCTCPDCVREREEYAKAQQKKQAQRMKDEDKKDL